MTDSPNESQLEKIFEALRQEYVTDLSDVRSEAAIIDAINRGLRYWPLKNLGEDSRNGLRDIARRERPRIKIRMMQVAQRRKTIGRVKWNAAQENQVRLLYGKKYIPVARIAARVGKSKSAVYIKASRLGLKRGKHEQED